MKFDHEALTEAPPRGLFPDEAVAPAETALRSAVLSDCGRYRYSLTRQWDAVLPRLCFVMLNPSTADASIDDPTIRKCVGFARRLGFGSIEVVNLFAWRATDPADLVRAATTGDIVGPENDRHIAEAIRRAGTVIAAWGAHVRRPALRTRAMAVRSLLSGVSFRCLGTTADGIPCHPLMLAYTTPLEDCQ